MYRNFCFTCYDLPTFDGNIEPFLDKCNYVIFQLEECPTTGRYHYQGYVELKREKSLKKIKKLLCCNDIHIEKRKGTAKEASDYCQKKETSIGEPFIYGVLSQQGKRTDLEQCKELLDNGTPLQLLPFSQLIRYYKSFQAYISLIQKPRTEKPKVYWITGKAGSGKTRYIFDQFKLDDIYMKQPNTKWWDGYINQPVILIDDFRFWSEGYDDFLRLLDRYPYSGEYKSIFGGCKVNSPIIYITSILTPLECYPSHGEDAIEQLLRRIDEIKYIT